jgi:hypothetical protein
MNGLSARIGARKQQRQVSALHQVCPNTRNQFLKHIFSIIGSP